MELHSDPNGRVLPIEGVEAAAVHHAAPVPAHALELARQGEVIEPASCRGLQGGVLGLLRREPVDGTGELVDALGDLVILQLLLPGRQVLIRQLDGVDKTDAASVGGGCTPPRPPY